MGRVSPFSSFRLEDFSTQRDWISGLFLPLNSTLGEVVQTLNGQTTFGENIPTFTKVLTGTNLRLPLSFQIDVRLVPTQMTVAQATRAGVPITMVGAWFVSGDTITVNELFEVRASGNTTLETGAKYTITLRFN